MICLANDCFELGRTASNAADYYHTLMWMQEALNRLEHEDEPTVSESEVLEYLAYALYQQGNIKRALVMTKRLVKIGSFTCLICLIRVVGSILAIKAKKILHPTRDLSSNPT